MFTRVTFHKITQNRNDSCRGCAELLVLSQSNTGGPTPVE